MVKRKLWSAKLSALGIALSLLGASHAANAGVVVELNVTKDFFGGYNASIVLDAQAKAMLTSNTELSFSLGHPVKSLYGATIIENSDEIIRLQKLNARSMGYTDKGVTSDKLSATNCVFAGQSCEIRVTGGNSAPAPTATPTKVATPTATATKAPTVAPTVTKAPTPTATIPPSATPTATKVPTVTPTATKAPTATPTKAPTSTPTATPTSVLPTATPTPRPTASTGLIYKGVNLAIAEFGLDAWGNGKNPGTYGVDYIYPSNEETDYFIRKGMNTIRLPFRWERLQPTLGGSFDSKEVGYLDAYVKDATSKGAYVLIDPHNYARFGNRLIDGGNGFDKSISDAQFADLWSKLAQRYKANSKVIFGLMNEPHDMKNSMDWINAANAAIAAIRATGATNLILVPGNHWTGAHTWVSSDNGRELLNIKDPGNNYAYEVHQYLDSDSSGTHTSCVSTTIGPERMQAFTKWLKDNKQKGFLGEFAGADNATCREAIKGQLQHMEDNSDVWIGWTWWAAGAWWGDYMFTITPKNGVDRPQMSWLTPFL